MTKIKGLGSAASVLALCLAFPAATVAAPTGALTIAENETPETLDPANATNSAVNQLLVGVNDALVQFEAGETSVSPQLATEWSVSEDG